MAEYAGVDITSSQLLLEEESEFSRDAIDLIVPEIAEAAAEVGDQSGFPNVVSAAFVDLSVLGRRAAGRDSSLHPH
eukprot:scaffold1741_cov262-Pinguiococcus_pyrenoidosus.AAC.18